MYSTVLKSLRSPVLSLLPEATQNLCRVSHFLKKSIEESSDCLNEIIFVVYVLVAMFFTHFRVRRSRPTLYFD